MKGGGCLRRLLKEKRGEGFVDVCVLVLSVALVLALVVRIAPVFVAKQNLDVFADELVRTWAGRFRHQLKSGGSPGGNRT